MKKISFMLRMLSLAAVCFLLTSLSVMAADKANQTWRAYLAPSDVAVMREMHQAKGHFEAMRDPANDPAQALAEARKRLSERPAYVFPEGISAKDYNKDGLSGLWVEPAKAPKDRVMLYAHGGGYLLGRPDYSAAIITPMALKANIRVFSPNYPLAPEHPFPAALDYMVECYKMLLSQGISAKHIVLSGDSAGGGLTVAILLKLRELGLPMPAGAYLISPIADFTATAESIASKADNDPIVSRLMIERLSKFYAPGQDLKNPYISPVFADMTGLPPLLIHVGTYETLVDDSMRLARNAALADVPVEVRAWPGATHLFQGRQDRLQAGRKALDEAARFINEALNAKVLY